MPCDICGGANSSVLDGVFYCAACLRRFHNQTPATTWDGLPFVELDGEWVEDDTFGYTATDEEEDWDT
jgi:hypothetical protein